MARTTHPLPRGATLLLVSLMACSARIADPGEVIVPASQSTSEALEISGWSVQVLASGTICYLSVAPTTAPIELCVDGAQVAFLQPALATADLLSQTSALPEWETEVLQLLHADVAQWQSGSIVDDSELVPYDWQDDCSRVKWEGYEICDAAVTAVLPFLDDDDEPAREGITAGDLAMFLRRTFPRLLPYVHGAMLFDLAVKFSSCYMSVAVAMDACSCSAFKCARDLPCSSGYAECDYGSNECFCPQAADEGGNGDGADDGGVSGGSDECAIDCGETCPASCAQCDRPPACSI